MAAPVKYNTIVNQKSSFQRTLQLVNEASANINLTGYTLLAKYKPSLQMSDSSAKEFQTEIIDANNGIISMSLTPEQTSLMNVGIKYFYDCAIIAPSGFKTRVIEGTLKIDGGVS